MQSTMAMDVWHSFAMVWHNMDKHADNHQHIRTLKPKHQNERTKNQTKQTKQNKLTEQFWWRE